MGAEGEKEVAGRIVCLGNEGVEDLCSVGVLPGFSTSCKGVRSTKEEARARAAARGTVGVGTGRFAMGSTGWSKPSISNATNYD